ncbi:MAG TPA: hypothetical protein VGG33_07245 [Polyangia bacterium]
MRKLLVATSRFGLAISTPVAAHAGAILEGSLGKGAEVTPDTNAQPLNVMIAPGFSFLILRLQLGLVADLPDVENSKFDIGLRPMLTLSPPILPLYARLIFAVNNLTEQGRERSIAYGGAVGLSFGLAGIGIFAEAGILPRSVDDQFRWIVEGRAGVSLGF